MTMAEVADVTELLWQRQLLTNEARAFVFDSLPASAEATGSGG